MRTELKIGIMAVLVVCVCFIVWTVFNPANSGVKDAQGQPLAADSNTPRNQPERPRTTKASIAPIAPMGLSTTGWGAPRAAMGGPDVGSVSYDSPPPKAATEPIKIESAGGADANNDANSAAARRAALFKNMTASSQPAKHEPAATEPSRPEPVVHPEPVKNDVIRPEIGKPEPVKPTPVEPPKTETLRPVFGGSPVARQEPNWVIKPAVSTIVPVVGGQPAKADANSTGEEVYEVKSGDSLWKIADSRYHNADPKVLEMIRKANKDVDFNRLAVGTKIKLPAAPTEGPAKAGVAPVAATGPAADLKVTPEDYGKVLETSTGQKVYIVKKDDNGLWGIAETVYKDGRLWTLLAKANPDAANILHPGQKIIVPPKESAPHPTAEKIPAVTPTTMKSTERYVVKAGDNGLEAIAKKLYGDGTLWPAIRKANPGVDSSRLKAGQELIVPSLEDAKAAVGATTRPAGAPSPARTPPAAGTPAPARPVPVPAGGSAFD